MFEVMCQLGILDSWIEDCQASHYYRGMNYRKVEIQLTCSPKVIQRYIKLIIVLAEFCVSHKKTSFDSGINILWEDSQFLINMLLKAVKHSIGVRESGLCDC